MSAALLREPENRAAEARLEWHVVTHTLRASTAHPDRAQVGMVAGNLTPDL